MSDYEKRYRPDWVDVLGEMPLLLWVGVPVILLSMIFFPLDAQALTSPYLIGNGSDPCVVANNCNTTNMVASEMITQDVILYCTAAFCFFFGFMVGIRMMLGNISRQE